MDAVIDELTARLAAAAFYGDGDGDARVFVGIAGSPGSGKSTLASAVRDKLNAAAGDDVAVVFPMDGFHYYRSQLADPAMFPDPEAARRRTRAAGRRGRSTRARSSTASAPRDPTRIPQPRCPRSTTRCTTRKKTPSRSSRRTR
jgi:energy-coupling factor transporter ATP-binding protein EcfA2